MTDARFLSLSWHLRSPLDGRSYCEGRSLPDWLKEVRSLRGSVLFDNGRRRHFRTEDTLRNGSLVQPAITVCSVGTGDRQDLMLARIGLTAIPAAEPINCDDFKDNVRVMYCLNAQQLNPRFLRVMVKMAKTIGLTQACCEI